MAIKEAKEFIKKLSEDEALCSAFQADPEGTLAAGSYGCTNAEVKEAVLMSRELDEKELYAVAGGRNIDSWDCGKDIGGPLHAGKGAEGTDAWDCGKDIGGPLHGGVSGK